MADTDDDSKDFGEPFFIDARSMTSTSVHPAALGAAMDLLCGIWAPTRSPFTFDAEALATRLNDLLPARGYTPEFFREHEEEIRSFFVGTDEGLLYPSPMYFSEHEIEEEDPS